MRNQELILAAVLILLVSALGCGGIGGGNQQITSEYHTGVKGISMRFMVNSPPTVMYDAQSYPFSLEVTNLGAATTSPFIFMTGHDTNIIRTSSRWSPWSVGSVNGRDVNYPEGGYSLIEEEVPVRLPEDSTSYSTTLKLTACYPYTTEAIIAVCVDPDPTNNNDDTCSQKAISVSGGQGGPVAVVSVTPNSNKGVASFTIRIQNEGGGEVILPSKASSCLSRLSPTETDFVQVKGAKIGTTTLTCTPSSIRLTDGAGQTTCKGTVPVKTAYTSNLIVTLDYGYKNSILTQVDVRRI